MPWPLVLLKLSFLCWWKRRFAKSGEAIDYFKWSSVYPWKIGKVSNVLSEQGCTVVKHGIGKLCRILPSSDLEFESKLFAVILISQPLWPNLAKLQWDFFSKAQSEASEFRLIQLVMMREGWGTPGSSLPPIWLQASEGSEGDWGVTLLSVCAFLYWSSGERLATKLLFSSGSWKKVIIWVLLRQI